MSEKDEIIQDLFDFGEQIVEVLEDQARNQVEAARIQNQLDKLVTDQNSLLEELGELYDQENE